MSMLLEGFFKNNCFKKFKNILIYGHDRKNQTLFG